MGEVYYASDHRGGFFIMYSGNSEGKDIQNVKEAQKYMGNETKRLEEQRKLHLVTNPAPGIPGLKDSYMIGKH